MQNLDLPDAGIPTTTTHLLASLLISLATTTGKEQQRNLDLMEMKASALI
jgi:hypothetical protein